ncbi:hypothetical protein NC652_006255 [Populus alba x Populus x berolinensis]|uniref:Uncharacterized protein n=4 Tax=Populus TaxID=3689 RepID=A0ACC4BGA5_POPAL|nr:uncharacterized protein LOC118031414 [Populus alba]KAG6786397.1 hypothetical protein POTOM_007997 [Populus tomentosa]KAJ6954753.1 hypothetical protein NC652_006255 [Populus alba x Populus x berolinensis]KAJ7007028.1 hypothetical protein NC653_006171 [Populus alba x Populus x berolinensis]TKR99217.1 hypothetical protein D5086_0000196060 [Populus alba]
MIFDLLLQAGLMLLGVFMFLAMHNIPQKFLSKLRYRNRADLQAKRHFVLGAQLIAQARSPSNSRSTATSLAKQAEDEANKAISLDPKDAASHILKALSLDLQGFRTSALESINVALSPLAVKSLSASEKGDALFKRAELAMGMNRRGRVEPAIEDLTEAVKLNKDNAKAFCLLGECYEAKKMIEEAKEAYEEALRLQPELASAKEKLDLLRS